MTFTAVGFLVAGMVATAVPIIIHLLWRHRRRPVPWAAMRFLLEAWRKSRRRLALEQYILLATRCLVLIVLGAALARPLLESQFPGLGAGGRSLYLVIDDGALSGLTDGAGETALQRQIRRAEAALARLGPGDAVGVVTTAQPAQGRLIPPSTDPAAAAALIRSLRPQASSSDVAGALRLVAEALALPGAVGMHASVLLLSDLRAGAFLHDEPAPQLVASGGARADLRVAHPTREPAHNVSITAIEPLRSVIIAGAQDGSDIVTVRLRRSGGDLPRAVSTVRLSGDGIRPVAPRPVEWSAGQIEAAVDFSLSFDAKEDREIALSARVDDDVLAIDNERSTILSMRRSLRGALIDRRSFGVDPSLDRLPAGEWMRRALDPAHGTAASFGVVPPVEIIDLEPATVALRDLQGNDFAVVARPDLLSAEGWSALAAWGASGGLILLLPPGEAPVHAWTDAFRSAFGAAWSIDREAVTQPVALQPSSTGSRLLRMIASDIAVLAPAVEIFRRVPIALDRADAEVVLLLQNGEPCIIAAPVMNAPGMAAPGMDAGGPPSTIGRTVPALMRTDQAGSFTAPGLLVVFAVAPRLDWTNLPAKPLMVPLMQELVRQGVSEIRARVEYLAGSSPALVMPGPPGLSGPGQVEAPSGRVLPLDERGRPVQPLQETGVHRVVDRGGRALRSFTVTVDVQATSADPVPADVILSWLNRPIADDAESPAPVGLSPWRTVSDQEIAEGDSAEAGSPKSSPAFLLLILLLALLIIEALLARRYSYVGRGGGPAGDPIAPTLTARGGARPDASARAAA